MQADRLLLDPHVLTVSPEELKDTKALWTLLGGVNRVPCASRDGESSRADRTEMKSQIGETTKGTKGCEGGLDQAYGAVQELALPACDFGGKELLAAKIAKDTDSCAANQGAVVGTGD